MQIFEKCKTTKATSGRSAYTPALYQIKSAIGKNSLFVPVPGQNLRRSSRGDSAVVAICYDDSRVVAQK